MGETILPADAPLLRGMAEVCDGLGPILAPHGASLTNWQEAGVSLRALADVLAALTPEVVAAVRSARSYRWPHAGPEERAALDAGLAALARLHATPRPATHEAPRG